MSEKCHTITTKTFSETASSQQLLEGPQHVVKLSSRHLDQPVIVHIVVMVDGASHDVGFRRLNKNA